MYDIYAMYDMLVSFQKVNLYVIEKIILHTGHYAAGPCVMPYFLTGNYTAECYYN